MTDIAPLLPLLAVLLSGPTGRATPALVEGPVASVETSGRSAVLAIRQPFAREEAERLVADMLRERGIEGEVEVRGELTVTQLYLLGRETVIRVDRGGRKKSVAPGDLQPGWWVAVTHASAILDRDGRRRALEVIAWPDGRPAGD